MAYIDHSRSYAVALGYTTVSDRKSCLTNSGYSCACMSLYYICRNLLVIKTYRYIYGLCTHALK